jgi:cell wall-associated NlpC family hydrolase
MVVVALMLATSATPLEANTGPETILDTDEPRHTQTVVVFGPYRPQMKIPTIKTLTGVITTPAEEPPLWINNEYRIKSGDTLSGISPALGFSIKELALVSGIQNIDRLSIGQIIYKPGTRSVPVPAPVAPSPEPVASVASSTVETVIGFAMSQLGDPYVYGSTGPNSWDCSGLVQAAFAHAGIKISRTTRTIINEGSSVSQAGMQRGDLVWPSSGHMGIYLGNGEFVHAPRSGDVVKISSVYSFYAARRI